MKFTLCSCEIFSSSFSTYLSEEKSFVYVKNGFARAVAKNRIFELKPGQGLIVGDGFKLEVQKGEVLGLHITFLSELDFKCGISVKTGPKSEIRKAAAMLFDNVKNLSAAKNMLTLLEAEAERFFAAANNLVSFRCADFAEISKEYIDKNFAKGITLSDVAEFCGISKSLLEKDFGQKYGITPGKYITQKRIDAAKELLTATDEKSAKIAESVGFASPQRFNDMFAKSTGKTPVEYRLRNKKV